MARYSRLALLRRALESLGRVACIVESLGARAFLAGGAAEGRLTVNSDVDVVVLLPREPSFEEAVEARARLLEGLEEAGIPLYLPLEFHITGPGGLKRYGRLIPLKCGERVPRASRILGGGWLGVARCIERGVVAWLTGLPASGKTSIAMAAAERLRGLGYRVEVLDGDWVRRTINPDAGYTREERRRHLLRVAWIARLLARNGVVVLCSFVSPYRSVREEVRRIVEEEGLPFIEVYVKCPLEECIRRDPKGLYAKALRGEIKHFTGISDPYEPPENPDLVLDTTRDPLEVNASKLVERILDALESPEGEGGSML